MGDRVFLKGGYVTTMDPALGDFSPGDVLIEDDRIVEVGPDLDISGAEVIDAAGNIVIPGFIDSQSRQQPAAAEFSPVEETYRSNASQSDSKIEPFEGGGFGA